MNLGDGLVFELENGKPKLIFTTHGFESKTSNKITKNPPGIRPPKLINASKQFPQEASRERTKRTRAESLGLSKNTSDTTTANVGTHAVLNGPGKTNTKRMNGMQSAKRSHGHKTKPANNPKESLVCLTQDQLQQLLSNIDKIACLEEPEDTLLKTQLVTEDPRENGMSRKTHEALISDGNLRKNGSAWEKEKDNRMVLNGTVAGLFSKLGERELEKEVLEARRAQWRRELDDQLVEKQQGRASATLLGGPRPVSSKSTSRDVQVQPQEKLYATTAVMEDMDSQASTFSSQRDLPAAIRSAFVLGEAAPLDEAFSAEKKEQQKRWLQELDKQRQEAQQRRRQEKLHQNQAEDHDHWAMHFDSFQKKLLPQPPVVPYDRGEGDLSSSLSHNRSPSRAMSSVSGRDNQGRSSVDTTTGSNPPKASYLRTMTALLDPAQLEERERKRQKQLEHQQAINTQVEERRRQREKEELERNQQEQEEEKRVAKEREYLQQQYLLDTQRERDKEELLSRRTEKMLLSVQRAQEEAQKDKQLQRIRDLARKGHDVSKLLGSLERRSANSVQTLMSQSPSESLSVALKIEELSPASPRRDTSVQTVDMADGISDGRAHLNYPASLLDMAVEHTPTPPGQPRRPQKEMQLQQQSSGKENMWNTSVEPRDVGESHLQEHSRRSSHRVRPVNGKRPEWNTRQPSRPFVPASERYPAGLRQHRQESRLRRQMELLTLVEKNASTRTQTLLVQEVPPSTCVKEENSDQPQTYSMVVRSRVCSPPIPTCSLNQQKQSLAPHHPYSAKGCSESSCNAPPSTDYVPYVRTDEVYHLDPLAMPQTQEAQRKLQTVVVGSRQGTPVAVRDPLLHPELLKNRERQQAILKGLSALRQGLLQKQRELETGLNPLLQGAGLNMAAPF